jgi:hypothetical protein
MRSPCHHCDSIVDAATRCHTSRRSGRRRRRRRRRRWRRSIAAACGTDTIRCWTAVERHRGTAPPRPSRRAYTASSDDVDHCAPSPRRDGCGRDASGSARAAASSASNDDDGCSVATSPMEGRGRCTANADADGSL